MSTPNEGGGLNAQRLALLAGAARLLHGETDRGQMLAWAVAALRDDLSADGGAACVVSSEGSPRWTIAPNDQVDFSRLGDPRSNSVFAPVLSMADRVRLDRIDVGTPDAERMQRALRIASVLVVPIPSSGELPLGAIFLGNREPTAFSRDDEEFVSAIAGHLGIALENQRRIDRLSAQEAHVHEVLHSLQEAVRPPIPAVDATELGVYWEPADETAKTGGDLYDWVTLPDGALHFAVVDVMGKGVAATKDALAVTHALRLLAFDGCPLEHLVSRADSLVCAQNPDVVATLMVGRYWPESGAVKLAGAGHPPALIVRGEGVSELAAPGIPIGWPGAGSHGVVEFTLDRADTLVLYTDGLIEGTKDILAGLDALNASALSTVTYPADGMARALVQRSLRGAAHQDDSLALVLRRRTPPVVAIPHHLLPPFEHRFSPNFANVGIARHLLRDWLERIDVPKNDMQDVLLVVAELCSNAVRHASGAPGGVALRARADGDDLVVEVEDDGGTLEWPTRTDEVPDAYAERGRGLFLVESLSDEVSAEVVDGASLVRVVRRAVLPSPLPSAPETEDADAERRVARGVEPAEQG
jgi:serine phosphatase RsbU (regulator of sigma subunit)/anti-sigma regulatory factor (Ser/Thr protein kinase)